MFWTTALVATGQAYPHHVCFATEVINKSFHWREWVIPVISYPGKSAAQTIQFLCFDKRHTAVLVLLDHPNMPQGWAFQPPKEVKEVQFRKGGTSDRSRRCYAKVIELTWFCRWRTKASKLTPCSCF